jgi:hypothetical protein
MNDLLSSDSGFVSRLLVAVLSRPSKWSSEGVAFKHDFIPSTPSFRHLSLCSLVFQYIIF